MQVVLDFKTIEQQRPENLSHCIIVFRIQPDVMHEAEYYSDADVFHDGVWEHSSDEILYWIKASF